MNDYTAWRAQAVKSIGQCMLLGFLEQGFNFSDNTKTDEELNSIVTDGLKDALEQLDEQLYQAAPSSLVPVKTAKRTLLTQRGDITYKRRIYNTSEGEYLACVDDALRLPKPQRIISIYAAISSTIACEESFEKTSELCEAFGASKVSKVTVKNQLQISENLLQDEEEKGIKDLFELGIAPEGENEAEDIYIEIDSTYAPSQERNSSSICIKGASIYAGKAMDGVRKKREHPVFVYGTDDTKKFKKRVVYQTYKHFARAKIKRIHIGFDGEKQYQTGWQALFGSSIEVYGYLDPFHINEYITRAFSSRNAATRSAKNVLYRLLDNGDVKEAISYLKTFDKATEHTDDFHVKPRALKDLVSYIQKSEDYITPEMLRAGLGTIESDHMRIAKARMCARPCGWSHKGANALVRVNAQKLAG